MRRTIFHGATPVYHTTTTEQPEGNVTIGEEEEADWVWLHAATEPRDAPSLTVVTVRDTGCPDDVRRTERKGDIFAHDAGILEMQQLGDVYRRAGRCARETW